MTRNTDTSTYRQRALALLIATAVMMSMVAPALAASGSGPDITYDSDKASPAYIHESNVTIADYDRSEMTLDSDTIEYYDDNGNVATLPAHYNASQDEPVNVTYTQVDADAYKLFPRVSGESGNSQTWLNASNWTTAGVNSTEMTVADDDDAPASGIQAVECSSSGIVTGDAGGYCEFETEVNITSDVSKRVLFLATNIKSLSGDVEVRLVDADGDYYYANASTDATASDDHVIATSAADGYVFQEKLTNLKKSGTVDEIQKVRLNISDGDADVTVVGLDVEKKSIRDLGTTVRDDDGDGNEDDEVTLQSINGTHHSGELPLTGLSSMGSWADDATIKNLKVKDLRYSEQDLQSSDDHDVRWADAEAYSYPRKVNKTIRLRAPSAIDLSHGTLELRMWQGLVDERYATVEYATATGDTGLHNVSDSSYTEKSGSFTNRGDYVAFSSVSAGNNQTVHSVILLQNADEDTLKDTGGGGGAVADDSGGGIFSSMWAKAVGILTMLGAALGLSKNSG